MVDVQQQITRISRSIVSWMKLCGFFASVGMRLPWKPTANVPVAATDFKGCWFNPEAVAKLDDEEFKFLIGHETLHVAMLHDFRFREELANATPEEHFALNRAMDEEVNWMMYRENERHNGKLWREIPGAFRTEKYKDWTAERIYADIKPGKSKPPEPTGEGDKPGDKPGDQPDDKPGGQPGDNPGSQPGDQSGDQDQPGSQSGDSSGGQSGGQSGDQPGEGKRKAGEEPRPGDCKMPESPTGEVLPAEVEGSEPQQERKLEEERKKWRDAVAQAVMAAKLRGDAPLDADRFVDTVVKERIDWRKEMLEFAATGVKNAADWSRQPRRLLWSRTVFPRDTATAQGTIVAMVDTSGSIPESHLAEFLGQCQLVLDEVRPEKFVVMDCDTQVHTWAEYEPGDHIDFKPKGGGGTSFDAAFDEVEARLTDNGDEVAGFVGFTDLWARFPDKEPEYPVLWVATDLAYEEHVPFGRVIPFEE